MFIICLKSQIGLLGRIIARISLTQNVFLCLQTLKSTT